MNLKEHVLEEVELYEFQVRDALQCLLHTILFVRAPGPLRPREAHCDHFNLTFARCGVVDVDKMVDSAVEKLWQSLTPAGPDLSKGWVTLSFFERRIKKSMFGLMSNEEKIAWEQWVLPILVNNAALNSKPTATATAAATAAAGAGASEDAASVLALQRIKEQAEETLAARLEDILSYANGPIDHMPPVMYEFEIACSQKGERRDSVYSRMMQAPSPLNL